MSVSINLNPDGQIEVHIVETEDPIVINSHDPISLAIPSVSLTKETIHELKVINLSLWDNRKTNGSQLFRSIQDSLQQNNGQIVRGLVLGHMCMGDQIELVSAVRYFGLMYDEIHVLSIRKFIQQVRLLYADDPTIHVIECPDKWAYYKSFYRAIDFTPYAKKDIHLSGIQKYLTDSPIAFVDIPISFYTDLELDPRIYWEYFKINVSPKSRQLIEDLKGIPYVFTHAGMRTEDGQTSYFTIDVVEKHLGQTKDRILMIDPCINHYTIGHRFYEKAENMKGHLINDYVDLLINADALYIYDSCFFCLAMHLGLKTTRCFYKHRFGEQIPHYDYLWGPKYGFDHKAIGFGSDEPRKRFTTFIHQT